MEPIFYSEIITSISSGLLKKAIELLLKSVKNSNLENDAILQSSRYHGIERELIKGTISDGQARLTQNQIIYALLELAKQAKELNLVSDDNVQITPKDKNIISNEERIKILFLAANPENTSTLRLDKELREIESSLLNSSKREKFEIKFKNAVRVKDLQDGLLEFVPDFVHFSGHGSKEGIILMDNSESAKLVENEPLSRLFGLFANEVSCVFLNSCYSESQATLIRKHIPNVIGMGSAVPDNTAIEFATVFYKAIGEGRPIEFAFEFAKVSLGLNSLGGDEIPKLL